MVFFYLIILLSSSGSSSAICCFIGFGVFMQLTIFLETCWCVILTPNVSNQSHPISELGPFSTFTKVCVLMFQLLLSTGAILVLGILTRSFEKFFMFFFISDADLASVLFFMIDFAKSLETIEHTLSEPSRSVT